MEGDIEIRGIDKRSPQKSWQGEGPYAGKRIVVLRMMTCNLKCHWNVADGTMAWCDTKWTWDGSEDGLGWHVQNLVSKVHEVANQKMQAARWEPTGWRGAREPAKIVMVTGGEPMLRQNDLAFQQLIEGLRGVGLKIHFETNGTVPPNEWAQKNIDFFAVSPKYQLYKKAYDEAKIKKWLDCGVQVAWKFVVGRTDDVELLRQWMFEMHLPKEADIWLMPLTEDSKDMHFAQGILEGGVVSGFQMLGYEHVAITPRLQIGTGRDNFP